MNTNVIMKKFSQKLKTLNVKCKNLSEEITLSKNLFSIFTTALNIVVSIMIDLLGIIFITFFWFSIYTLHIVYVSVLVLKKNFIFFIITFGIMLTCLYAIECHAGQSKEYFSATTKYVSDGDTIVTNEYGAIRLKCVDTPELHYKNKYQTCNN